MKNLTIGFCGLNCEECPVLIATNNDDNELRHKTAKEWSELYSEYLGDRKLGIEDINCQGCRSEGDIFIGCMNCVIRGCCKEKQLSTCADCNDYNLCDKLNGFFLYQNINQQRTILKK